MSDLGTVGEAQPTAVSTPVTGTSMPSSWISGLLTKINPMSGIQSSLGNVGLVAVGVVLAVGALLISQKETVIQVAARGAV